MKKVVVITSKTLAKSAGIQSVTQTLFKDTYPIVFLEDGPIEERLEHFDTVLFSGFDEHFIPVVKQAKAKGMKVAVFWHFGAASEVDVEIGTAWRALLPMLTSKQVDLFITCKKGLESVISKLFDVKVFFILNNSECTAYRDTPKDGIGIYSGSSDYWVKNLRPNLYAALMSGKHVDILPYDNTLKSVVSTLGLCNQVSGTTERLEHDAFLKRMSQCELVTYVTFAEGAPILPLEALNNGVICLTGDNHHYFEEDLLLHKFLVVTRPDDPEAIYKQMMIALKQRDPIIDRYYHWKTSYDKTQTENFRYLIDTLEAL